MADKPLPVKCETPGCDCKGPLVLHPACHPHAATWTMLVGDMLLIRCCECDVVVEGLRVTGVVPGDEIMIMLRSAYRPS